MGIVVRNSRKDDMSGFGGSVGDSSRIESELIRAIRNESPVGPSHLPAKPTPTTWSVVHVYDRIEEAYEILRRIPMATRPPGYANSMPKAYRHDFVDLVGQIETGALAAREQERNRVRLGASAAQIRRMEEALGWPARYLTDKPEVARAVGLCALWSVMKVDVDRACKRMRVSKRTIYRRQVHGLTIIAQGLVKAGVPVS